MKKLLSVLLIFAMLLPVLSGCRIVVNYYSVAQPTTSGNWWYYDNNGKPAIWPEVTA